MFQVGLSYKTQSGRDVKIVEEANVDTGHHCVRGDDGVWRYARPEDAGRVTASAFDLSDPNNLITPKEIPWCVHIMGPDSILAAESREEALQRAREINAIAEHAPEDILFHALPRVWPGPPEAHRKALADGVDWSDVC